MPAGDPGCEAPSNAPGEPEGATLRSRYPNPFDRPQQQIGSSPPNFVRREDTDVTFEVRERVELVVGDVFDGHEGDAVAPADLGDSGGLHVFAEGPVPGVETVDALVELRPDVGRRDATDVGVWRTLRDLFGQIKTLRPRLGSPALRRLNGQIA